ncbi:adenylosuccinate lyase [Candidatus Nitrosocosmicus arcticus]|uniref:Adenylosuccinate lyase n=1 Tax=Candidatus Nitrosocosmicus arcticus TaxID=2035267 RepID=A0A557SST8_9ARCH|nr:adenylosuccinate lyase [Candidatus Nitrosocosmicus arcticus]TVP39664.1 Adenylosuccinate lyase [Candidatus Nitrosocosmicus arcticus]
MPILPIDSGRYGTKEMKDIFEEDRKLNYELIFECAVASAQAELNIIPREAYKNIEEVVSSNKITVQRVKELESISDHDIAAIVEAISELCSESSKPWIHYGLTSNDVVDSSTSMQMRDVFKIVESKLHHLIKELLKKSIEYQDLPAVGRTHGQHASITSFGLKFAIWSNELLDHLTRINEGKKRFLLCKTLGVVGTGSLMRENALEVQKIVAKKLDLFPTEAATQVIPRERYSEMLFTITLIALTLDKIAIEIRNLQRTEIGEVQEPFKKGQMGSSAVPVKKNPIKSERISSLARIVKSNLYVSFENIALWHERDLSNSANERFIIPMSSILIDDMISTMIKIIAGLKINNEKIVNNIELTKGQIFAEFILQVLILKGISRFKAYRDIQSIAFKASEKHEHFFDALIKEEEIINNVSKEELEVIFNPQSQLSASKNIIRNIVNKAKQMNIY